MTKVKMLMSVQGYNDVDGINDTVLTSYVEGQEYEIGNALLECFVSMGAVEIVEGKAVEPEQENKAKKAAPENKGKKKA